LKGLDPEGIQQFGLVAEDVEKVNPDLIARDRDGKPYTVRYEAVNAMLLNEFLKEHKKVEQQERKIQEQERKALAAEEMIAELKSGMNALAATVKDQAAKIQKVSAELETRKPGPQVVLNSQ